jgi:hypothetical protein
VWGPSVLGYPLSPGTFKVTVTVMTVDSVPNLVATVSFDVVVSASQVSIGSPSSVLSGRYLPVKLSCEHTRAGVYDAGHGGPCSGRATVTTRKAVLLASASYSLANGKSTIIRLRLTTTGMKVLANAKARPVEEKLSVTLKGRQGITRTVLIS